MSTPVSVIESHLMNSDADVVVSRNEDVLSGNENVGVKRGNENNEFDRGRIAEEEQVTELVDTEVNYCLIGNEEEQVVGKETRGYSNKKQKKLKKGSFFVGDAIPGIEAREKWGWRYELKAKRRKGQG